MSKYKYQWIALLMIIGTFSVLVFLDSCTKFKFEYHPDNLAEEIVEDVIKGRTGVDIDLTPSTPE